MKTLIKSKKEINRNREIWSWLYASFRFCLYISWYQFFYRKYFYKSTLLILVFAYFFSACSKDDGIDGIDDRKGEPYKFKLEISLQDNFDKYKLYFSFGNYNYNNDNGFPVTGWIVDPDEKRKDITYYPSPMTHEFEIPRNFNKCLFSCVVSPVGYDPTDGENETVTGKLYINNKLIISSSTKFDWNSQIKYDSVKKTYIVTAKGGETLELKNFN